MHKKREIWETNRDIKRRARRGFFWCWGCDGCLVSDWTRCPACGTYNKGVKREKYQKKRNQP